MRIVRRLGMVGFLIAMLAATAPAQDAARIVGGNGIVEVFRNGSWTAANVNEQIRPGEKLRTGAGSFVTAELAAGSALTLSDNSEVELQGSTLVLTSGTMQIISMTAPIQVAAKSTTIRSVEHPIEMQVKVGGNDNADVNVSAGAIGIGNAVIRSASDSNYRTYTAGRRFLHHRPVVNFPSIYVFPQVGINRQ